MATVTRLSDFKGRGFLLRQLTRPVETGRMSHAQIFSGPRGSGKRTAAKLLVQAMCCTGSAAQKPCGLCPSCLRFAQNSAPELMYIKPGRENSQISVDTVRSIIDEINMRPDSGFKFVIIESADRMTEQAQNALLKTLEEAPEYAHFILTVESSAQLLPTIRSRCTLLRFAPLDDSDVLADLPQDGYPRSRLLAAVRTSGGSIGRALEYLSDDGFAKTEQTLISAFTGLKTADDVSKCCTLFKPLDENSKQVCGILESAASEMMCAGRGSETGALAATLIKNGIDGAVLMRALITFEDRLRRHISFQSALEMLLYEITRSGGQ